MIEQTTFERAKERLARRDQLRVAKQRLLGDCVTLLEAVRVYERQIIIEAMQLAEGQLTKAASMLGISYQELGYILDTRQEGLRHKPKILRPRER